MNCLWINISLIHVLQVRKEVAIHDSVASLIRTALEKIAANWWKLRIKIFWSVKVKYWKNLKHLNNEFFYSDSNKNWSSFHYEQIEFFLHLTFSSDTEFIRRFEDLNIISTYLMSCLFLIYFSSCFKSHSEMWLEWVKSKNIEFCCFRKV